MRRDDPADAWAVEGIGRYLIFLLLGPGKILILLRLRGVDMPWSGQNPGSKGLRGKILRNKELAEQRVVAAFASDWFGFGRTSPLCAVCILGQGCTSHAEGLFLWRAVENRWRIAGLDWPAEDRISRFPGGFFRCVVSECFRDLRQPSMNRLGFGDAGQFFVESTGLKEVDERELPHHQPNDG